MSDEVLLNKRDSLIHYVARVREDYGCCAASFNLDVSRQDAVILNVVRAFDGVLAMAFHLIRREHLDVPADAMEAFELLAQRGWIAGVHLAALRQLVKFRFVALHEFQLVQASDVVDMIPLLNDLLEIARSVQDRDLSRAPTHL